MLLAFSRIETLGPITVCREPIALGQGRPLIGTGTPLRLTTAPSFDIYPVWSPDGRQIAFTRRKAIYTVPALGDFVQLDLNEEPKVDKFRKSDGTYEITDVHYPAASSLNREDVVSVAIKSSHVRATPTQQESYKVGR